MSRLTNLKNAKKQKNDEFYTLYKDIEKELTNYKKELKGKVIYCNCDNFKFSNFWKFFVDNFEELGIKKIIATCYREDEKGKFASFDGKVLKTRELLGDGDFRSEECTDLLKECDIIITNPPFSLFREYTNLLFKYDKFFLIMGNLNAIAYNKIFEMVLKSKISFGSSTLSSSFKFKVPDFYILTGKTTYVEDGVNYTEIRSARWFTNIKTEQEKPFLKLTENFEYMKYKKYDNYDAINIDRVKDIPDDYYCVMGVPITFMDKHNPNQFKVLGITSKNGSPCNIHIKNTKYEALIEGKFKYKRIFIKRIDNS